MNSYTEAVPLKSSMAETHYQVIVEVGELPIAIETSDFRFMHLLHGRYSDYVKPDATPEFVFEVELTTPNHKDPDSNVEVWMEKGEWRMERGDFEARWNSARRRGSVRQSPNPYSIDSVLRIVHTLLLAESGGFLLHASSAVRNRKAYLFSGVSEAGKTTISRLAPSDVALLTDEASYIRKTANGYKAYGTPFAGELGRPGENIAAPIDTLYLLHKAATNSTMPLESADAVRRLMRNILFFSRDKHLVKRVFEAACAFVGTVPVDQLSFYPDKRVWDLIG